MTLPRTSRKRIQGLIHDTAIVGMLAMVAGNLYLTKVNSDLRMERVKVNSAALKDRGAWMHSQHDWSVFVSRKLGIEIPPSPPPADPVVFDYEVKKRALQ